MNRQRVHEHARGGRHAAVFAQPTGLAQSIGFCATLSEPDSIRSMHSGTASDFDAHSSNELRNRTTAIENVVPPVRIFVLALANAKTLA